MEALPPLPPPGDHDLDGGNVLLLVVQELCARGLLALRPADAGKAADRRI
ncbi:hypothetical protein ACFZAU_21015 [Streptomyces sp. NPDC008238]